MDFVTGLSITICGNDTISVVTDRLTKLTHFLVIKKPSSADQLLITLSSCQLCIGSGSKIHICILESLSEGARNRGSYEYDLSPADRWSVRGDFQTLEDMVRDYVLQWEGIRKYLPLSKFNYI